MKKALLIFGGVILLVALLFFFGPRPQFAPVQPEIAVTPYPLNALDSVLEAREAEVPGLKPGNESKIVWYDSIQPTEYSLVYLHGFSASPMEGYPVHTHIAKKYGMNLYLPRIYGHGVDTETNFADLTPEKMMASAREAVAIANKIGNKVIVMSCSTGGTYSIFLSANNPELIDAQILYSPNIALYNESAKLLTGPWGVTIGKYVLGDKREIGKGRGTELEKYWTYTYMTEGVIALQALIDQTMTNETFRKVEKPTMVGYYYKSDSAMDSVVSVVAMRNFIETSGVSRDSIMDVPFATVGNHVLASELQSDDIGTVVEKTEEFVEKILGLKPKEYDSEKVKLDNQEVL